MNSSGCVRFKYFYSGQEMSSERAFLIDLRGFHPNLAIILASIEKGAN